MTDEVLRQRADLERAAAGRTLCDQLAATVQAWGDLPAYSDRDGGPWQTITWRQTREQALLLAAGFAALGLQPGERVALMLPNRVEHVLADYGAVHAGGVPVTFYATLAADQIGYVAADCDARVAVLDGADQLARWQPVLESLPGLRKIIVRDAAACPAGDTYLSWQDFTALGAARLAEAPDEVAGRVASIRPSDPATLLYTSGTTGNPKGVIITHASILYELVTATESGNAPRGAEGVGEDPGRDPGPARRRAGRGKASRGGGGDGYRASIRAELPVRPAHAGRPGRRIRRGRGKRAAADPVAARTG